LKDESSFRITFFRYFYLMLGLAFCGLGQYLSVQSGLGTNPWNVVNVGAAKYLPFTIGQTSQLIGIALILVSYLLKVKPRIGTICNMYFVGFFYDVYDYLGLFPNKGNQLLQYTYLLTGILAFAVGIGMYISTDFGAGPRDGFTIAVQKLLGWSTQATRVSMEVTALVIGFLLGGPVGIGTAVSALFNGPLVQVFLKLFNNLFEPLFYTDTTSPVTTTEK
jgi:uncharacterized membrane protein YczE